MLKRIGVIGDVHAEAVLLEMALAFFQSQPVDCVICVGDIVDGPGDADHCCQLLQQFGVHTVRGNHDRWLLDNVMRDLPEVTPPGQLSESSLSFLKSLPRVLEFETVAGRLLLCHGVGNNDMQGLAPDDYGYALECNESLNELLRDGRYSSMICGHTHQRMVRKFDALTAINPGTLYRHFPQCCTTVDFEARFVQFHDFEGNELIPFCERSDF